MVGQTEEISRQNIKLSLCEARDREFRVAGALSWQILNSVWFKEEEQVMLVVEAEDVAVMFSV